MLYRICTEDKNRRQLTDLIDQHFDGYTLYTAEGRWKGKAEDALVIELAQGRDDLPVKFGRRVFKLAEDIKVLNEQESVLIEKLASENTFI